MSKVHDEFPEPSRKRRKLYNTPENQHTLQDGVAVAYGTNKSRIHLLSPAEGKVVVTLDGVHSRGIRDFKFCPVDDYQSGWSLGGDGNLVQWNLKKVLHIRYLRFAMMNNIILKLHRIIPVDTTATTLLPTTTDIFYASHTVHRVDLGDPERSVEFRASTTNVQAMVLSSPDANGRSLKLLTSTHSDRQMLVFDLSSTDILVTLVAQSDIISLSYLPAVQNGNNHDRARQVDLLAVVTVDHKVEIFTDPFNASKLVSEQNQNTPISKRKARIKRSSATIQLQRQAEIRSPIRLLKGCLNENALLIAWVQDGMNVCFEEIPCTNQMSGEFILSGVVLAPVLDLAIPTDRGIGFTEEPKNEKRTNIDESHAIVLHGGDTEVIEHSDRRTEVIDISSAMEETDSSDNEANNTQSSSQRPSNISKEASNGHVVDNSGPSDGINLGEEPSFGELIAASVAEPIEVAVVSANDEIQDLAPSNHRSAGLSTNLGFSALLPQALNTNDNALLERCLHVADTNMVRATVERLSPTLAAPLLQKLAERLHSRPGRAGTLLVWIQWTLVAHGGYLGTQITNVKKLGTLYQAVRERANNLQPLLSLKGKLDLLEAQTNMRKSMQQRLGNKVIEEQIKERAAVYLEGQDEADSENDLMDKRIGPAGENLALSGFAPPIPITDKFALERSLDDAEDDDHGFEEASRMDEANRLFDLEASESDQNTSESIDEEINDDDDDVDSVDEEERSDIQELSEKEKAKSRTVNGIGVKVA